jgi:uncharacterized protein
MDLIQALLRLNAVDDEYDEKARLYRQARERLTNPQELLDRRAEQESLVRATSAMRAELADLELELESLQSRLAQVEKDLYGGKITASRELENLRRDSDMIKHRVAQLEDRGLELLTSLEEREARVKAGSAALAAFESQWEQGTAVAREDYQVLRTRLQELQVERDALRAEIPGREAALYDELRRTKGGRPLAPMHDGICQVCRVSVPRHKVTVAERGQDAVVTCEGCGRILYQG